MDESHIIMILHHYYLSELSCHQYHELTPVEEVTDPAKKAEMLCNGGSWGTCLESCNQAKVKSSLMSDGKCHEVESERIERPCHTEYCGISDPCVIPFVVHLILAFCGLNNDEWDETAESLLIDAVASSVKNARGDTMFEPTDVELLMTSPWYEEIMDANGLPTGDMSQLVGTKLVIEIHIHNPNSLVPFQSLNDAEPRIDANIQERFSTLFGRKHKASQNGLECRSSDLFELAQKAHEIQYNLGKKDFMPQVVNSLQKIVNNMGGATTALSPLISNQKYIEESIVVSSWIIKTAIGGGSIYDHKLDPFPGAISYVHVYFPTGLSTLKILMVLIVVALVCIVFRRQIRRIRQDVSNKIMNVTSTTFVPKPFEMVRRKLGMYKSKRAKASTNNIEKVQFLTENASVPKKSRIRSRLNEILSN